MRRRCLRHCGDNCTCVASSVLKGLEEAVEIARGGDLGPVGHDLYVIGSLRNPSIRVYASELRAQGFHVFDDWSAAHPEADDHWRDYEKARGRSMKEALQGLAGRQVFGFDKTNLDLSKAAVLVAPAGKSAHLELGYILGKGKPGFVLFPEGEPERWDVMYQFATGVCTSVDELAKALGMVL